MRRFRLLSTVASVALAFGVPLSAAANCPNSSSGQQLTAPVSNLIESVITGGPSTYIYQLKTTNLNPPSPPNPVIPGVIEYCVYPDTSLPSQTVDSSISVDPYDWTTGAPYSDGFFSWQRGTGDPNNLPLNGTTWTFGTATFASTPSQQLVLVHINDPDECGRLGLNPNTCFVRPGTISQAAVVNVCKFNDENASELKDPTEPLMDGWKIDATGVLDGSNNTSETSGTTGQDPTNPGCVSFKVGADNLDGHVADITFEEEQQAGWTETAAYSSDCTYTKSIDPITGSVVVKLTPPITPNTSGPACTVYFGNFNAELGGNLSVSKTAEPDKIDWKVTKSVDQPQINIAPDGTATFNYTISVTHSDPSKLTLHGAITISNLKSVDIVGLQVSDVTTPAGTCTITDPNTNTSSLSPLTGLTVPANTAIYQLTYSCTFSPIPTGASINTVQLMDKDGTVLYGVSDVEGFTFSPTSVEVIDSLAGDLGPLDLTSASPTTFTYPLSFNGDPAGTCTDHPNTVKLISGDNVINSADATVKVCVGADLTVTKDATPTFTRTYKWNILKNVDKTKVNQVGGSVTFNYEVDVSETGFTDSAWQVTGTIHVTNPNDWEAITFDLGDAIDNGGSCSITGGGTGLSVAPGATVDKKYTCTYSSAPSPAAFTNKATASWNAATYATKNGSASGTATGSFTTPTTSVNKTITVTDSYAGTLGTLTATDSAPFTSAAYKYARTITVQQGCVDYSNTATIVETGQTSSQKVTVCGPVKTGALTIGFWKTTNGQNLVKTYCGADPTGLGAYLRGLGNAPLPPTGPFYNAPSSCSSLATYVYNILNGASATDMNRMLKAQMLGTALDVWFSGPGWTSTVVGGIKSPSYFLSHNNLGTFKMDTTAVCPMVDNTSGGSATCLNNTPSTNAVASGAVPSSPMSMQSILDFASTVPAPFNGSTSSSVWYAGNRTLEEILKNIYDQFNNQMAFGSF